METKAVLTIEGLKKLFELLLLFKDGTDLEGVWIELQVLDIAPCLPSSCSPIPAEGVSIDYRLSLSDGKRHYPAYLSAQKSCLVESEQLQQFDVIVISPTEVQCFHLMDNEKRCLVINDIIQIKRVNSVIGKPKLLSSKSIESTFSWILGHSSELKCVDIVRDDPDHSDYDVQRTSEVLLPNSMKSFEFVRLRRKLRDGTIRTTHLQRKSGSSSGVVCAMPQWALRHLEITENETLVSVEEVTLPEFSRVVFEAQDAKMMDIPHLEFIARDGLGCYSTFTVGNIVPVRYQNRDLEFKVIEIQLKDNNTCAPAARAELHGYHRILTIVAPTSSPSSISISSALKLDDSFDDYETQPPKKKRLNDTHSYQQQQPQQQQSQSSNNNDETYIDLSHRDNGQLALDNLIQVAELLSFSDILSCRAVCVWWKYCFSVDFIWRSWFHFRYGAPTSQVSSWIDEYLTVSRCIPRLAFRELNAIESPTECSEKINVQFWKTEATEGDVKRFGVGLHKLAVALMVFTENFHTLNVMRDWVRVGYKEPMEREYLWPYPIHIVDDDTEEIRLARFCYLILTQQEQNIFSRTRFNDPALKEILYEIQPISDWWDEDYFQDRRSSVCDFSVGACPTVDGAFTPFLRYLAMKPVNLPEDKRIPNQYVWQTTEYGWLPQYFNANFTWFSWVSFTSTYRSSQDLYMSLEDESGIEIRSLSTATAIW
eukprot:TRINITY_DN1773_c0_g2_i2.p1 TRINITY_DN1773_c0_g2~~TRINITY_DN1773_c0_g2_i2.p1  ORF type:complete len:768 (+),score=126.13 TRINITY_DN1773_c0_g2_i2:179-2305(+)